MSGVQNILILPIAAATCVATLIGGWVGISLRDRLHLVLAFSAGAVIGVAFFDLLPEAVELAASAAHPTIAARTVVALAGLGFLLYLLLDRSLPGHASKSLGRPDARRAWAAAGSFAIHSFLDGFAIGIAFQAGRAVGIAVAVAVLAHDFSDGLNTVSVVLRNGGDRRGAFKWLVVDAVAPLVGAVTSMALTIPSQGLAMILALFSGFFLYVGGSDLLPESHHAHPRVLTTVMTIAGAVLLYVVAQVAG
ncbi:MAG TPA: ZIP family metal transporter [Steroidobacteraceae bacterium]|nr:ZIP family metal transporter [Steroidobacteraceae bacterium]